GGKNDGIWLRLPARVVVAVGQAFGRVEGDGFAEYPAERVRDLLFPLTAHGSPPTQSVYSNTLTTFSTPPTLRAISVAAASSSWLTMPIRYTTPCALVTLMRVGSKPGMLVTSSSAVFTRADCALSWRRRQNPCGSSVTSISLTRRDTPSNDSAIDCARCFRSTSRTWPHSSITPS